MQVLVLMLLCLCCSFGSSSIADDEFQYLPKEMKFDTSVPTPEQHLGFRIGERHLQHHQLVSYLSQLSKSSDRITHKVYAYSHGGRPCLMLTITSPENHQRLQKIREDQLRLSQPKQSESVDLKGLPAVINMGYSVHGDESSASNAAAVVAYYLAAGQGAQIDSILENCVILLDPCLNPDGFNRFASWANGYVGRIQNADPSHAEHNQPFPGGRVNYYWFDLNRDWLPAQHPESKGRLTEFHAWKPNVVLDFHEMGTNSTYFFQPGIPTRNNPLTPKRNYDLTREMSLYHARALDKIGSIYMTEERFDDFYMGKGSTYPDLHGSVGILFEQASSRGHRQESINGELTFPFTIRNQVKTSLSSLEATVDLRLQLLEFKKKFYTDSLAEATKSGCAFFEFRCPHDRHRLMSFAEVLLRHDITVFEGESQTGSVLFVPAQQPEFRFLLSLTEKRTQFEENIFYDVSTWHLPSAFGVQLIEHPRSIDTSKLTKVSLEKIETAVANQKLESKGVLGYAIDWRSSGAAPLVGQLAKHKIRTRIAKKPFAVKSDTGLKDFPHGTLMVPLGIQQEKVEIIAGLMQGAEAPVTVLRSGITAKGIDLGSNEFAAVEPPAVAMLIGSGVSRYEAGEVWHLFDTRLKMPLTLIDTSRVGRSDLERYTSLVLVSGSYSSLSDQQIETIENWVEDGGNLVLCGSSVTWAKSKKLVDVELVTTRTSTTKEKDGEQGSGVVKDVQSGDLQKPFDQARNDAALKRISGAIFETNIDRTHPLGYGYTSDRLRVFRNNEVIVKPSSNPYANAAVYTSSPQVAGYCSEENVNRLKRSTAAMSLTKQSGTVMIIPQNPNFRAFWYGTNRLFVNAVLFGNLAR